MFTCSARFPAHSSLPLQPLQRSLTTSRNKAARAAAAAAAVAAATEVGAVSVAVSTEAAAVSNTAVAGEVSTTTAAAAAAPTRAAVGEEIPFTTVSRGVTGPRPDMSSFVKDSTWATARTQPTTAPCPQGPRLTTFAPGARRTATYVRSSTLMLTTNKPSQ